MMVIFVFIGSLSKGQVVLFHTKESEKWEVLLKKETIAYFIVNVKNKHGQFYNEV